MAGHGGLTSGSWKPGKSANPGGRPKMPPEEARIIADVKAAAKAMTPEALETLRDAMTNPAAPYAARVSAAIHVLDRGWGKPKESVDITHKTTLEDLVMANYRPREEDEPLVDLPN